MGGTARLEGGDGERDTTEAQQQEALRLVSLPPSSFLSSAVPSPPGSSEQITCRGFACCCAKILRLLRWFAFFHRESTHDFSRPPYLGRGQTQERRKRRDRRSACANVGSDRRTASHFAQDELPQSQKSWKGSARAHQGCQRSASTLLRLSATAAVSKQLVIRLPVCKKSLL